MWHFIDILNLNMKIRENKEIFEGGMVATDLYEKFKVDIPANNIKEWYQYNLPRYIQDRSEFIRRKWIILIV
jgi:hypothetical protein